MKIAISGFSGSGKTTLAKKLKEKFTDLELITPSFKDLAKEMGIRLMELQERAEKDPTIDLEFDKKIKEKAEKSDCIVASWLAIWLVKADLRIFLYSPFEERARRVALRDKISLKEAREHIAKRDRQNIERYKKLYNIDITKFNDSSDIVFNSSSLSLEKEVGLISSFFNKS